MSTLYGVPLSPFVRKTMLAHVHKNMPFELKMTMPGSDDVEFRLASPTGKIPGYKTDDEVSFSDSSVIIAYLERINNNNTLYPEDASKYAQALWFEEWADTEFMTAAGALYFQRVIGPAFFQHETDEQRVTEILTDLLPKVFELVESRLSEENWLLGEQFTIADLSVGACLVNLLHANYQIDQARWPKLVRFQERFLALPMVQAQIAIEQGVLQKANS